MKRILRNFMGILMNCIKICNPYMCIYIYWSNENVKVGPCCLTERKVQLGSRCQIMFFLKKFQSFSNSTRFEQLHQYTVRKIFDEEKSKHGSLAQENGFGLAFLHMMQTPQGGIKPPAVDWLDVLIGPGRQLLFHSRISFVIK